MGIQPMSRRFKTAVGEHLPQPRSSRYTYRFDVFLRLNGTLPTVEEYLIPIPGTRDHIETWRRLHSAGRSAKLPVAIKSGVILIFIL
jgi:hypothetical protein